jgi:hypothetical protein
VRIPRAAGFKEDDLTSLIGQFGARVRSAGYRIEKEGEILVCEMTVHANARSDFSRIAKALAKADDLVDFDLTITSR